MPGPLLTTASTILCPHGGRAVLTTANARTTAQRLPVLLETDVHTVVGCPFTLPGPKPSPCVRIQWSAGSPRASVNGTPVLTQASLGLCYSPESAPQGVALIVNTQPHATAQ